MQPLTLSLIPNTPGRQAKVYLFFTPQALHRIAYGCRIVSTTPRKDITMYTIYSRPGCTACKRTVKVLDRQNKNYVLLDAADHAEELREQGFTELPVVVDDNGETFSGFRYDRLTA